MAAGRLTHHPLDYREVLAKAPGTKYFAYEDLPRVRSLRELLPATLLLYQLADVGHFATVFENAEGVNVFDPLGFPIDEELKLVRPELVKRTHQDFQHLSRLLLQTRRPIVWSPWELQSKSTAVCGHWCACRLVCAPMRCDEFAHAFDDIRDRDEAVALWFQNWPGGSAGFGL